MKAIILTIIFAFGGEERVTSMVMKSAEECEQRANRLMETRNVRDAVCSELKQ